MKHKPGTMALALLVALACFLSSAFASPVLWERQISDKSDGHTFDQIMASEKLVWKPCYNNFTCARLKVPLDYSDLSAGTTVIAFVKWTSPNATDPHDILVNPGGPGGSGVQYLLGALDYFLLAGGYQNNYVGFDPRGVNNSGPSLSCFNGNTKQTEALYEAGIQEALDVTDRTSFGAMWKRGAAFGEFCTAHHGTHGPARYANTVGTAMDMLQYTKLLAKSQGKDPEKAQLWFWGASYGTILGSTFASLFPQKVGRMFLDAVVDGKDYYMGKWEQNVLDADAAVENFFESCFAAGKELCKFWDVSVDAIRERFEALQEKLRIEPATVSDPKLVDTPSVFTYRTLQTVMLSMPYNPIANWPLLGRALALLETGKADDIAVYSHTGYWRDACSPRLSVFQQREPLPFISCNDANGRNLLDTLPKFHDHVDIVYNQSRYIGEAFSLIGGNYCQKLNLRAPKSQVFEGTPSANKTSFPILFGSNTIDPVTPLRSAVKTQRLFGGSGLLVQDAVGHSTGSTYSVCTFKYITSYFTTGELPPEGLICKADLFPFQNLTRIPTTPAAASAFGLYKPFLI